MVRARVALGASAIALVYGVLTGLRQFLPFLYDSDVSTVGAVVSALVLVGYVVNPGGALVLGYLTGRVTEFAGAYGALAIVTVGTAFVGGVVGYAAIVLTVFPAVYPSVTTAVLAAVWFAFRAALTLGIAFVAGGATATFRSPAFRARPE